MYHYHQTWTPDCAGTVLRFLCCSGHARYCSQTSRLPKYENLKKKKNSPPPLLSLLILLLFLPSLFSSPSSARLFLLSLLNPLLLPLLPLWQLLMHDGSCHPVEEALLSSVSEEVELLSPFSAAFVFAIIFPSAGKSEKLPVKLLQWRTSHLLLLLLLLLSLQQKIKHMKIQLLFLLSYSKLKYIGFNFLSDGNKKFKSQDMKIQN